MAPSKNNGPNQQSPAHKQKKAGTKDDRRYVLSARAQSALMWILEEIIDKTLTDAHQLASAAGKERVELAEIEKALKLLCERYHARWSDVNPALTSGNGDGGNISGQAAVQRRQSNKKRNNGGKR